MAQWVGVAPLGSSHCGVRARFCPRELPALQGLREGLGCARPDPHPALAFLSFQVKTKRRGQAAGPASAICAIMAGKDRVMWVGHASEQRVGGPLPRLLSPFSFWRLSSFCRPVPRLFLVFY